MSRKGCRVRKKMLKYIGDVGAAAVATGFGRTLGNKVHCSNKKLQDHSSCWTFYAYSLVVMTDSSQKVSGWKRKTWFDKIPNIIVWSLQSPLGHWRVILKSFVHNCWGTLTFQCNLILFLLKKISTLVHCLNEILCSTLGRKKWL